MLSCWAASMLRSSQWFCSVATESRATRASAVMALPMKLDWSPGLVSATAPTIVQVKLAEPL